MSDDRAFDEPLPWLAPVEDEDEPRGISARRMLAALVVVLIAAAIIAATFFWLGHRDSGAVGPPQLIKAPPGPYKVKPPNPGGLDISGDSQTAFETSAGEDKDSQLDTSKLPASPPAAAPAPGFKAVPKKPEPIEKPAAASASSSGAEAKASGVTGSVVQLGAFANPAQAERAWTALSARFPTVAAANKMIVPFPGGIRLRAGTASAADARQICATLKAAGENCFVAH